nr:hypothetical protein [Tanacetum cinerariifolium]
MVLYDKRAGSYRCQLDEQWFVLTKDTLREALQITPINNNQPFVAPPSSDALINFVNELGYLKLVKNVSNVVTNDMFKPWRALLTIINLCLMGKSSGFERPRAPVLYLAGETGSVQDSPAPKPTTPARKPKSTAPKAPPRPAPTSAQPAPTSAPAKPQGKKHKQATKASDKPPKGKKSKYGVIGKKHSLKSVAASEAEDVPVMEPQVAAKDIDFQKDLEESMKTAYALPRGKGKAKVTEEQVAHDLLSLEKPKKKSPADQYIFQRRVFEPTGSFEHDEFPYVVLGQSDNEDESKKVVLGADEGGQGEGQDGPDPGAQAESQMGSDASDQDEGQARSNPGEISEGQAGPDPGNAGADVHNIPNKGFTITTYLRVQENLKLAVEEHVLLEDPASSSGTLSSLQHLSKDISFRDLFFSDKPTDADKNADTEVESMVNFPIQQALSSISLMTSPIIDLTLRPESPKLIGKLEHIMANLIYVNKDIEETLDKHGSRLYMLEQLDIHQQVRKAVSEVVTDAVDLAMQAPLRNRFRDLPEADMKEILHQRMWETESYKSHEDHMQLFEALEKSMNHDHSEELAQDLAEARKKKKKSLLPPPLPPSSTNQESPSKGSTSPSSSKTAASAEYQTWTTTDVRLRMSISLNLVDLEMDANMAPDEQAQSSNDEDIGSAHIPKVNLRQDWWKPFEEERPATPEPAWLIRSSDVPVPTNNWASALASNYSPPPKDSLLVQTGDITTFMDCVDDPILRHNVSKPLPLGGPPGQVIIQSDFFFSKDLEYLRYDNKGRRPALSISKMKAAYYPDVGLEQMVPNQFWIEEEAVMTHMRILSVVRIKVFSKYKYDYMKKIVLRRVDLNEHVIAERDFNYLYPSDFEDLYMLNLQGHLNHLPPKDKKILTTVVNQWTRHLVIKQRVEDFQLGIESYQTQLNLTKPQWDATGFEYKHDYTVIDSLKAVMQIDEALDYRFKEFRINRINLGLNIRFWTRKDVARCKEFMFAIQRRLRTRRIFRNLESFVGGRVREGDYILLKRIPTVAAAGQRDVNSQPHAHTLKSLSMTQSQLKDLQHNFGDSDVCCYVQEKC